jgi:hypothetical protein
MFLITRHGRPSRILANADRKTDGKAGEQSAAGPRNRRSASGRRFEYWEALLRDPRAAGRPWLPLQQMRLSEISRELLRVECTRCFRTVEIQRLNAVRLYGPRAVRKDVGQRLLDDGCQIRTGRLEEDGCWPNWMRYLGG